MSQNTKQQRGFENRKSDIKLHVDVTHITAHEQWFYLRALTTLSVTANDVLLGNSVSWRYSTSDYICIRRTSCTTSPCASSGAHTYVCSLEIINGYCEVVGFVGELNCYVICWQWNSYGSIHQDDHNIWFLPPWSVIRWPCILELLHGRWGYDAPPISYVASCYGVCWCFTPVLNWTVSGFPPCPTRESEECWRAKKWRKGRSEDGDGGIVFCRGECEVGFHPLTGSQVSKQNRKQYYL